MADELTEYYRKYHKERPDDCYRMDRVKETSRITILKEWVKKYFKPGDSILDIGCGGAHLSAVLPEYKWSGIDVAPMAQHAVTHDLMSTPYPFPAHSFDGFICSEVLEHLWDCQVVHEEVARLSKPGAIYLLSTPNVNHIDHFFTHFKEIIFDERKTHFFEHIRWYDRLIHQKLIGKVGFQTLEYSGADAHWTHSMQDARRSLVEQGVAKDIFHADVILGKCFKEISHTIMIAARLC